jgi:citrate synthase
MFCAKGVTLLAMVAPDAHDGSQKDNREKALRLVARMATFAAAWDRIRKGLPVIPPDPTLSHSANFIYMVTGKKPTSQRSGSHGHVSGVVGRSRFECVHVYGAGDCFHSCPTCIPPCAGRPRGSQRAFARGRQRKSHGDVSGNRRPRDKVDSWVEKAMQEKRKIMGFGHRVYKVEDPRSVPLRAMAHRLSVEKGDMRWYNISIKVAEAVQRHKNIYTNVDFYSATVFTCWAFPSILFTTVFAAGRVAGWCAHVFEQLADNRLIRPRTDYTGPTDRVFKPLAQR